MEKPSRVFGENQELERGRNRSAHHSEAAMSGKGRWKEPELAIQGPTSPNSQGQTLRQLALQGSVSLGQTRKSRGSPSLMILKLSDREGWCR